MSSVRLRRAARATVQFAADVVGAAAVAVKTGVVQPVRPDRPVRALVAVGRYGLSLASVSAAGAAMWGERTAIVDDEGVLTFEQLDHRISRIAAALIETRQVGPGRRLGVMCRNHRGFVEAVLAGAYVGSDIVPLNTDFAGPQLGEVLVREAIVAVIVDDEFIPALDSAAFQGFRIIADRQHDARASSLADLRARGNDLPAPRPRRAGPARSSC
ncbi:MAG: AMP-binding protein [Rhodococcus sp. (in: high G+C Gram-positive bacteria)]|uniref:AMP-binding protein n=1 Tax=Rhodococcus sp. TaxID=1831 RepID=UPI002AD5FDD7|nr:AMP-binding protein [Rhodococcus sp. (in: high G+C Gram-positive bacteria)]